MTDDLPASVPTPYPTDVRFGSQPWIADALCRQHPEINFFTGDDKRDNPEPALAVCRSCPVIEPCLDYAVALGASTTGVWGGTTGLERAELRRLRHRVSAA